MRFVSTIILALSFSLIGCETRWRQERITLESTAGERLVKLFWLHESLFPERPRTNLAELFDTVGNGYPDELHESFRRLGRDAGFSNLFYERYVFVPPGMSNALVGGDVILIGVAPFPEENGQLVRVVIFRNGFGYEGWGQKWVREDILQGVFATAKVEFPKPAKLSPQSNGVHNSRTLWARIRDESGDWARFIGMGRNRWWVLVLCCGLIVLTIAVLIIIWLGRRGRG